MKECPQAQKKNELPEIKFEPDDYGERNCDDGEQYAADTDRVFGMSFVVASGIDTSGVEKSGIGSEIVEVRFGEETLEFGGSGNARFVGSSLVNAGQHDDEDQREEASSDDGQHLKNVITLKD